MLQCLSDWKEASNIDKEEMIQSNWESQTELSFRFGLSFLNLEYAAWFLSLKIKEKDSSAVKFLINYFRLKILIYPDLLSQKAFSKQYQEAAKSNNTFRNKGSWVSIVGWFFAKFAGCLKSFWLVFRRFIDLNEQKLTF